MDIFKTRFVSDIICEFTPPARKSNKVIILCGGLPSPLAKSKVMAYWAQKGYWVFNPRYRGTWESDGQFLRKSPATDILDVAASLNKPFHDLLTKKKFKLTPERIVVIGSSFGGSAALMAAFNKNIEKVIALSPVVDWTRRMPGEPSEQHLKYMQEAYGPAYRFKRSDWRRLYAGKVLNPIDHANEIPGDKILILHAKDDNIVTWRPVMNFAKKSRALLKIYGKGGHFGLSSTLKAKYSKQILAFLKAK